MSELEIAASADVAAASSAAVAPAPDTATSMPDTSSAAPESTVDPQDEYAQDTFAEFVPEAEAEAEAAAAPYASDDYADAGFEEQEQEAEADEGVGDPMEEEEEVESAPDATVPPAGLAEMQALRARSSEGLMAAAALNKPAPAKSSSSSSSLPSLLPSISLMSSSLTAAGRAHFAQSSLFGKQPAASKPARAAAAPVAPTGTAFSLSSAAAPSSDNSRPNTQALAAYAASNRLCASESLGIHPLHIAPFSSSSSDTSSPSDAASAPGTSVLLDGGRLKLWTGAMDLPSAVMPSSPEALAAGGADPAASLSALSNAFLRAALVPQGQGQGSRGDAATDNLPFMHVPIDPSDPLSSTATAVANGQEHGGPQSQPPDCVTDDGAPAAELHPCFHPKRLGPYRFRIVARGTSMPPTPQSFEGFVERAHQLAQQGGAGEGAEGEAGAADTVSAFDTQSRVTIYVAVEKLLSNDDDDAPAAAASSNGAQVVLPLLPLDCPTTFWLSTHHSSLLSSPASGLPFTSSLLFGSSPTDPSDQLELTLVTQPLHARILAELELGDPRMEAAEEAAARREKKAAAAAASAKAAAAAAGGTLSNVSRSDKKKQRRNAKKRKGKQQEQEQELQEAGTLDAAVEGAAAASPTSSASTSAAAASEDASRSPLVSVVISPASATTSFSSSSSPSTDAASPDVLVLVSIVPSALPAPPPAAAAAVPSLVDLLATLAVSPSTSLPSSILGDRPGDSFNAMAQRAANIANRAAAAAAATATEGKQQQQGAQEVSQTVGAPTPSPDAAGSASATAASVPSSSAVSVLLASLERRVHWPFAVHIDAMRVSEESEGHQSVDDASAMDLLHNRPLPAAVTSGAGGAKVRSKSKAMIPPRAAAVRKSVLVGDHEVELLRTVGLLSAWERPRDGSALNRPVLVSQTPHLAFHVQLRITRLEPEEAHARAMEEMLNF